MSQPYQLVIPQPSYQCPTPQACPPCAMTYPGLFGTIAGMIIWYAFGGGKRQWEKAVEIEVQKRLQQSPQSPQSPQKPSVAQSTQNIKQLEQRLITMLQGNRETALRLVQSVRKQHPNKPAVWCWEKAIEELERDRY